MDPVELWLFFPLGYLVTILIETPVLLLGLAQPHPLKRRFLAGLWLTACTYPIVVLLLPLFFDPTEDRWRYLLVAETFAPIAECGIFWMAFGEKESFWTRATARDFAAIVVANLLSFGPIELYEQREWLGW